MPASLCLPASVREKAVALQALLPDGSGDYARTDADLQPHIDRASAYMRMVYRRAYDVDATAWQTDEGIELQCSTLAAAYALDFMSGELGRADSQGAAREKWVLAEFESTVKKNRTLAVQRRSTDPEGSTAASSSCTTRETTPQFGPGGSLDFM